MAYSGKFKPKNPKKYKGDFTNIVFRSMWEKYCFKWCDENADVKSWSSDCLLYTSPSPRDRQKSRMPSSA